MDETRTAFIRLNAPRRVVYSRSRITGKEIPGKNRQKKEARGKSAGEGVRGGEPLKLNHPQSRRFGLISPMNSILAQNTKRECVGGIRVRQIELASKRINFTGCRADTLFRGTEQASHVVHRIQPDAAEVGTFMVRHSGFLTLIVAVVVTVFAVAGHSRAILSDSSLSYSPNTADADGTRHGCFERTCEDSGLTSNRAKSDTTQIVDLGSIPHNARIIVGSLDLSGAPHVVTLEVITRGDGSSNARTTESEGVTSSNIRSHVLSAHPMTSAVASECSDLDQTVVLRVSDDQLRNNYCLTGPTCPGMAADPAKSERETRQFLIPHFEPSGTTHEVSTASLIACDAQVAIFADDSLLMSHSGRLDHVPRDEIIQAGERILQTLEMGLQEFVQHCVGPISDLDGDQHLSIVITDLDRQDKNSPIPVRGCVRDRDFLEHGAVDFTGDIVYLDCSLPHGSELAAMLAHELTHAAVFSRIREQHHSNPANASQAPAVPSWLNEAIAHWVELRITARPEAFLQRVALFQANPACNPIVASESFLSAECRRGGSRAAGVLFLRQFVPQTDQLSLLLHTDATLEERLAMISGTPFADVFRKWTMSQALSTAEQNLNPGGFTALPHSASSNVLQKRLYGTAFFVLRCNAPVQQLQITSEKASQLQITVVEPGELTD